MAICIKGQPTFNNDQLPSTPRGQTGVTVIILTGKACYCITASFGKVLKMSRKPQKYTLRIKKRGYSTYAATRHNDLNVMKTLCVWGQWGGD